MSKRNLVERYRFGWRYHLLLNTVTLAGFSIFWYSTIRMAHPGNRNDIWIWLGIGLALFYVNFLWVWPWAVVKGRLNWLRLLLITIANIAVLIALPIALSVAAGSLTINLENAKPADILSLFNGSIRNFFPYTLPFLLVLAASLVAFLMEWIFPSFANRDRHQKEVNQLRLAWRRAQLDPHLLDTHLVMLSVITRESQAKAQLALEYTIKVIQFYIGGNDPQAPIQLEEEVACLRSLIKIQRIRHDKQLNWQLEIEGDIAGISITPMILMPLAENMVRHATLNHPHVPAVIRIRVVEQNLFITTENHIRIHKGGRGSGTGLANLRERLNFVYPQQHRLAAWPHGDRFYVELAITGIAKQEPEL